MEKSLYAYIKMPLTQLLRGYRTAKHYNNNNTYTQKMTNDSSQCIRNVVICYCSCAILLSEWKECDGRSARAVRLRSKTAQRMTYETSVGAQAKGIRTVLSRVHAYSARVFCFMVAIIFCLRRWYYMPPPICHHRWQCANVITQQPSASLRNMTTIFFIV